MLLWMQPGHNQLSGLQVDIVGSCAASHPGCPRAFSTRLLWIPPSRSLYYNAGAAPGTMAPLIKLVLSPSSSPSGEAAVLLCLVSSSDLLSTCLITFLCLWWRHYRALFPVWTLEGLNLPAVSIGTLSHCPISFGGDCPINVQLNRVRHLSYLWRWSCPFQDY